MVVIGGLADHIGIVTSVGDGKITTVEGNTSNAVNTYTWNISNGISDYIGEIDIDTYNIIGYYSLATHQERNN